MEQLEQGTEQQVPGRRAYSAFKEYRTLIHTPKKWDDPQWVPKWQQLYKSRARAGTLNAYQTMILSVVTDDSIEAAEMRNLIAVLALLPSEKVLPFYNFMMWERMELEAADALEFMDTFPVPMHNPRLLPDLNCKTLHEYAAWRSAGYAYGGYGTAQRPFSLYAEGHLTSGGNREGGVFDRSHQVAVKVAKELQGAGVVDMPLVGLPRATVQAPTSAKENSIRASNQKLAQDK